ncbi:MAG TPA: tetratricopeptide repeat protein, partial [Parasegetibacter sp.]
MYLPRFTYLLTVLILSFLSQTGVSQTKYADSIRTMLYRETNSEKQLKWVLALCEEPDNLNRDSLDYYAMLAKQLSVAHGTKRQKLQAELAHAHSYFRWGWLDSTLSVIEGALEKIKVEENNVRDLYFKLLRLKALSYGGWSMYSDALSVLYKIMAEAEQYRDTLALATSANTIGSIAIARGNSAEAENWIKKALAYCRTHTKLQPTIAACYINWASVLSDRNSTDSAMYFLDKAISVCRRSESLYPLATALQIKSNLLVQLGQQASHDSVLRDKLFREAENALQEMFDIRRKTNSVAIIIDDNLSLARFYAGTGQLEKAIEVCRSGLLTGNVYEKAESEGKVFNNRINTRLPYLEALAGFYKEAGDYTLYEETLEQVIAAKDSFNRANSADAIAELQTQYEAQRKENIIMQQRLNLVRKNSLFYSILAGVALVILFAVIIFRQYRAQQKEKLARAIDAEKLATAQAVASAEEKERVRIAADLHDNLGVHANAILYGTQLLQQEKGDPETLVDNLHDTARNMLLCLRETLWVLKNKEVNGAELWLRIIQFAQQVSRHHSKLSVTTSGMAPANFHLKPGLALNAVLIVQKAVTNVVRHETSDKISIVSRFDEKEWKISIVDYRNRTEQG